MAQPNDKDREAARDLLKGYGFSFAPGLAVADNLALAITSLVARGRDEAKAEAIEICRNVIAANEALRARTTEKERRNKIGKVILGAELCIAAILDAAPASGPTFSRLPVCPKCQQGFVCEHCGEPIGDYYAAVSGGEK